jgi:hypothetical protein
MLDTHTLDRVKAIYATMTDKLILAHQENTTVIERINQLAADDIKEYARKGRYAKHAATVARIRNQAALAAGRIVLLNL